MISLRPRNRREFRRNTYPDIPHRRWSPVARLLCLALVIFASAQLVACQSQAQLADPVTVQLGWFHGAEFAGFYVADQQGAYTEENLEVTLLPGGPNIDPFAPSTADITISTADSLLRAIDQGENWLAIAAIYRINPAAVVALPGSGILNPADLIGKRIGVRSQDLDTPQDQQFVSLLKHLNIDMATVQLIPLMDQQGIDDLTSVRVQAASGFLVSNQTLAAKLNNISLEQIYYSDYGIPFYPNLIITSASLANERPDLVQRFVRATLKGYRYALEHPEEAASLIGIYDQAVDIETETAAMRAQIPLIDTGDVPIGWMDQVTWQITQDTLLEQGAISAALDLNQVFTNQFVENSR